MIATSVCLLALAVAEPVQGEQKATAPPPALLVEASLSTAGPYGELWVLRLTPNGDIALRVYYSLNPSGSLMAEFHVPEPYMDGVRRVVEAERFFHLPEEISPETTPLHQPDFRLEIRVGDRKHKVQLYDPAQLKGNANAKRFLAVWARVYEGLPLKPSW